MRGKGPYDVRYDEFVTCPGCGQTWQLLDWGCARHALQHPAGVPPVPEAAQQRIFANAAAHGVHLRWEGLPVPVKRAEQDHNVRKLQRAFPALLQDRDGGPV